MAGPRNPRRRRRLVEGIARGETGTSAGEVAVATVISRVCCRQRTTNDRRPTTARRLIALLAVVRKTVSLFPAISYIPLSDVPDCVRQPDCTVHGTHRWPACDQSSPRISNRAIHPRGRSQSSSEKSWNSDDGRFVDCHFYCDSDFVVGGPEQPIRMDCCPCHLRLCCYRLQ